jgi:16S rRNA (adenine1518-N6/adenine1519-N6)-dimethyltransferase
MPVKIKPFKKYGQHFLKNINIANKIVDALEPVDDEIIVEIGAGPGILTDILFQREYKQLIALEIDPRFIKILKERYGSKINIIEQSVLDFSFKDIAIKSKQRIKVIGNIPYNITSPILFKLIEYCQYISDAVLMVQKEIADRLLAHICCKEYGILSILVGYHARILNLFNVKRENFYPEPKVDSTVIKMEMYKARNSISDYPLFNRIVHVCFNTRRKMIQNSLKRLLPPDAIVKIKTVPLTARPEELSIQNFIALTNEIMGIMKK